MPDVFIVYEVIVRESVLVEDTDLLFMGQLENLAFLDAGRKFPDTGYTVQVIDFGIHHKEEG